MKRAGTVLSGSTQVAAGMIGANLAVYAMTVAAARLLVPRDLGAVTALLGILQIGTVVCLGLQAVTARRMAVAPEDQAATIGTVARVAVAIAAATGLSCAAVTAALAAPLNLDSLWPAVLTGATLVPLTLMGAMAGVAQGAERWSALATIYLANGLGRLGCGLFALLIEPSVTSAMLGFAVGAWAPVIAGLPQLRGRAADGRTTSRRPFVRETVLGSHALLAYYALSNADALLARFLLSPHDSGLYGAGLILSKAAVFFPQFITIVVFPLLARDATARSRHLAVAGVAALGLAATVATALLPDLALVAVGGHQYAEMAGRLWLFVLGGSILSIVNLLVWDALARHAHGIVTSIWVALVALVATASILRANLTGLVAIVIGVVALLVLWVLVAPTGERREPAPAVRA
ncbi:MAG: polysaccharide biosynthesis protein [Aeromicrobium sp.]|uniref:lipopolysaccharide biosynthesis protein n=1 Tax=Aeromicrobium sp. TaxID=1871063 RepID=UPI0039E45EC4